MSTERDDTSWDADQLRRQLQAMDETDFEHLVGDLWELQGWDVDVSEQSADAGIDIRATQSSPYNRKVVIQAKRYGDNSAVSGPAVQQYAALKQQEGNVDESIIVTTSRFTGPAEKRAQELNVKLIDGEALMAIIESLNAYEVAEQYINYPSDPDTSAESDPRLSSVELSPEQRAEVEEYMDQDIDSYLRDDEYRATRAMERARERVELNPHDAKKLGVFDDLPLADFEREFTARKGQLVLLKDDLHLNNEGKVYIEDLTDYIDSTAIRSDQPKSIVGVIRRGVQDGEWVSTEGEAIWEATKQTRRGEKEARATPSSRQHEKSRRSDAGVDEDEKGDNLDSVSVATDRESGRETGTESNGKTSPSSVRTESTEPEAPPQMERAQESEDSTIQSSAVASDSEQDHESTPELDLSRTKRFYGVAAGTGGWLLFWAIAAVSGSSALGGFFVLVSWPLLPIAMFLYTRKTGFFSAATAVSIGYIVLSAVPLLGPLPGIVYLYRRENSWNA